MKLTPEDIKILQNVGYKKTDMPQIEKAISRTAYTLIDSDDNDLGRLSVEEVIEKLGRKLFLYGIARSAFHWTACRNIDGTHYVHFDSSVLFK